MSPHHAPSQLCSPMPTDPQSRPHPPGTHLTPSPALCHVSHPTQGKPCSLPFYHRTPWAASPPSIQCGQELTMRAALFLFIPSSIPPALLSRYLLSFLFSLLLLLSLPPSSCGQPSPLTMNSMTPSYQFNNRSDVFLAVLPTSLYYFGPKDHDIGEDSAMGPIIQYHSTTWWATGDHPPCNDTYLIDVGDVQPPIVPVVLISGSDVQTKGYNLSSAQPLWGRTVTTNKRNGHSPSFNCPGSVGCSSRTTGILYLLGCFGAQQFRIRFSMDGGKEWNNSAVDYQLFGPGVGLLGLADPRCEVDPVSGEVILFSGLRYANAHTASDLVNTVWANPGGGANVTDPTLWSTRCGAAPWPARADAASAVGYSSHLGRSIVWLAGGHQVGYEYGYDVIANASSPTNYTVVSPGSNDVWTSSDMGATWDLVTLHAPWSARAGARLAVSDAGTLVLAEGSGDYSAEYDGLYPHDIWASADGGATWGRCVVNSSDYAPRRSFGMTFDTLDLLWLSSGQFGVPDRVPAMDLADILVSSDSFDSETLQNSCGLTMSPCGIGARCYPITASCSCVPSSLLSSSSSSTSAFPSPSSSSLPASHPPPTFPTSSSSPAVNPPASPSSFLGLSLEVIVAIVVGVVAYCVLCIVLLAVCWKWRKNKVGEASADLTTPLNPEGSTPPVEGASVSSSATLTEARADLRWTLPSAGSSYGSTPSSVSFGSGSSGGGDEARWAMEELSGESGELHLSPVVYVH